MYASYFGAAFTKNAGQRKLVKDASKVIIIEGCFINCASRMMEGVLTKLKPIIVKSDSIYGVDTPFGINEVPEQQLKKYSEIVAAGLVKEFINSDA